CARQKSGYAYGSGGFDSW
nr:immunoglobulin heavy chain junction region [Macaca mulatta]MOX01562.1 immunoglobulin heavy chain junction region [Macaca mulatta]MOX04011.1 immunoglobulin heavy chain junction region [Macaca mulatta]MOX05273.1 immunoglobulin heavy chain junction region [Macaca mulatta]MOX05363.1 immunoglobulin heavy chain junction region [Macaca mulatta]